jgi:hypothetical protein
MKILVTDVTEMHRGNYCVAGWCYETRVMVRPLPNGANWTAELLSNHRVTPGATIEFDANGQPNSANPHRKEDTPIDPSTIRLIAVGSGVWSGLDAPPVASTLSDAFE